MRTTTAMLAACLTLFVWLPATRGAEPVEITRGEYRVILNDDGLVVYHGKTRLSLGSYFTLYQPKYEGNFLSYGEFWKVAKVERGPNHIEATAELPKARARYRVNLLADGVEVELSYTIAEGTPKGPTEHAAFQIPADVVDGATVRILNAAGAITDEKPMPAPPVRGLMTRSGDAMRIHTADRIIEITAGNGVRIAAFDSRIERYGKRQGLWVFSGLPVAPGYEVTVQRRLRVLPLPEPQPVGTVNFADGTAVKRILVRQDAPERERFAAGEIAAYIEQICGRKLAVTETDATTVMPGDLVLGELAVTTGIISREELKSMERDGYVVRVTNDRGAVCGWRDLGTIYGAYALVRQLGVKFYAPGCEVVPRTEALIVPTCQLRAKPLLEFRKMSQNLKLGHTPSDDLGEPRDIGEPGGLVHSAAYLVPFDTYHETHPEYFALQKDGKRLRRDPEAKRFDVHLCLSNPDVQRISAERLMALMDKLPNRTYFGVAQGDGHAWCRCEPCLALDTVPGKVMTDRLITYVNAVARYVAKKHPEKRILTLAYTKATSPPPTRVKPEPNVMVQFCPYPGRVYCQSHFFTCEKNVGGYEDIQGWFKVAPKNMYIFDYPRGYKIYYEPFGSFYAMKQKMEYYLDNGVRGIYYCGIPTNFKDLFTFVHSAMQWDRKANVEALIDEFMPVYYGKAAPFIREYFDTMHREVVERDVHQMCEGRCPGIITPKLGQKALALFAEAEKAVADDRVALHRVRAEKFCVLFADLNERNPVNGRLAVSEDEFAQRLAEFMTLGRVLGRRSIGRRDDGIVSDWLYRICRLRTHTKPWFADPLCRRMAQAPAKTFAAERKLFCQKEIKGGLLVEVDAFVGGRGPEMYSHECEARRAVWIYGTNTKNPSMHADFMLDATLATGAKLIITGQDDDKPGVVEIEISINGKPVFSGPNGCVQNGWSAREIPLKPGVCKVGKNTLTIRTLKPSAQRDKGWFMLSECKLMFGAER
jgi:hypothetical protein